MDFEVGMKRKMVRFMRIFKSERLALELEPQNKRERRLVEALNQRGIQTSLTCKFHEGKLYLLVPRWAEAKVTCGSKIDETVKIEEGG